MSTNDYPNQEAFRKANNIYLDVMRSFIKRHLRKVKGETVEDLIRESLYDHQIDKFNEMLDEHEDVALAIDFNSIPQIIKKHWHESFEQNFNEKLIDQNRLWLIKEGRNKCEHRGPDLDPEFTRTHLYLIAKLFKNMKGTDKHEEIEAIRDQLLLDHAEKQISEITKKSDSFENDKKELKTELSKTERLLENSKKENLQNKKRIEKLKGMEDEKKKSEKQVLKLKKEIKEYEEMWKLSEDKLKDEKQHHGETEKRMNSFREQVTELEQQFEEVTKQKEKYKKRLEEIKDELSITESAKTSTEEQIAIMNNLLATISIDNLKVDLVYPPLNTDSKFHILDRRNTNKTNYLYQLLELKKPTLIYVQDDEMINNFMKLVGPEKWEVIGQHYKYTTNAEEEDMLKKLEKGELNAIVSNDVFTSLTTTHCIQHFVFCHLSPSLETFVNRCKPVFISSHIAFLHIIYNGDDREKNNNWLTQKFPIYKYPKDSEELRVLYTVLKEQIGFKKNFVTQEKVREICYMEEQKLETCFTIFEELGLLRRNEKGIKLLEIEKKTEKKKLEDSEVFCQGEKLKQLKQDTLEFYDFQLGQSVEQVWKKITE